VDDSSAKACSERDAKKITKTLGVAGLREKAIHIREKAGDRFAVSKQISVVIDEDRDVKFVFQDRTQSNIAFECSIKNRRASNANFRERSG